MKILAIGNSFSQDATRYLYGIARADGVSLEVVNLYIGGCSLERHYRNMLSEQKAYALEINGHKTGFFVSLNEALANRQWDIITLQQASPVSADADSYSPYIEALNDYIKKYQPKAKIYIHQTWAYEKDSARLKDVAKFETPDDMMAAVRNAYNTAAKTIKADGIIPSGDVFEKILKSGIERIHRDTFHASYGLGRYALALTWYKTLTGNDVTNNTFCDFDEEISDKQIEIVKKCVMR